MIDLRDDGTMVIDFPDPTGKVTVRQPTWGGYKRLRREHETLAQGARDAIAALPKLDAMPDAGDDSDEAAATRERLTPEYVRRVGEVQEIASEMLAKIWRLILLGAEDGSLRGLATPAPPEDPDEWPVEILVDAAEWDVRDGERVRTNDAFIEQWFRHVGKVGRSRSGPTQLEVVQ